MYMSILGRVVKSCFNLNLLIAYVFMDYINVFAMLFEKAKALPFQKQTRTYGTCAGTRQTVEHKIYDLSSIENLKFMPTLATDEIIGNVENTL